MGLALSQMQYDRQDPHNHARFIYREPRAIAGTTRRASILMIEGLHDSHVPNNATRSLAWLLGPIPQVPPIVDRVSFLSVADAPLTANVDAQTTAGMLQYGCPSEEGHYCAQSASQGVVRAFMRSALIDAVPTSLLPLPNAGHL